MLVKRCITLNSTAVLAESILRREDVADAILARDLLDSAQVEVTRLLAQAQVDSQRLIEQALASFWASTNSFLQSLDDHRLTLQHEAVESAQTLLNVGMTRLLDDVGLAERVRALVRNLSDALAAGEPATLSCEPAMLAMLREWIVAKPFASHWQLKADPMLAPDSLRLTHANGIFDIDWPSLRRGLLTHDD